MIRLPDRRLTSTTYLKFHHGFLHAFYIKYHTDQIFHRLGQFRERVSRTDVPYFTFIILKCMAQLSEYKRAHYEQVQTVLYIVHIANHVYNCSEWSSCCITYISAHVSYTGNRSHASFMFYSSNNIHVLYNSIQFICNIWPPAQNTYNSIL